MRSEQDVDTLEQLFVGAMFDRYGGPHMDKHTTDHPHELPPGDTQGEDL